MLMIVIQVAKNFVASFYRVPPGTFDTLMHCSVSSLSLQERYSLVAACNFLVRSSAHCSLFNDWLNDTLSSAEFV